MSIDWYQDVLDWHNLFGVYVGTYPKLPPESVCSFSKSLVDQEYEEFCKAWEDSNLEELVDAIADLIYVLNGTAISYGVDLRPVWDEVQRTNMSKVGGSTRKDGRVLKPEGWLPPDIKGILAKQSMVPLNKEQKFSLVEFSELVRDEASTDTSHDSWYNPSGSVRRTEVLEDLEEKFYNYHTQEKGTRDGITCTCENCNATLVCEFAFDFYNLNGDCLAVK